MTQSELLAFILRGSKVDAQEFKTIYRLFLPSDRYFFDLIFSQDANWFQFDTSQDAHYFGVWVNPAILAIFTYAEGDWTLVIHDTSKSYDEEIAQMIQFYAPGFIAKSIDLQGRLTTFTQDRSQFFLLSPKSDLFHHPITFAAKLC